MPTEIMYPAAEILNDLRRFYFRRTLVLSGRRSGKTTLIRTMIENLPVTIRPLIIVPNGFMRPALDGIVNASIFTVGSLNHLRGIDPHFSALYMDEALLCARLEPDGLREMISRDWWQVFAVSSFPDELDMSQTIDPMFYDFHVRNLYDEFDIWPEYLGQSRRSSINKFRMIMGEL